MNLNVLGRFLTLDFTYWKGMTKDNHLGAIYGLSPQKASNLMVELLGVKRGATLETKLAELPTKEFENDEEYYWDVVGSSYRNIPLVEARDEGGKVVTNDGSMVGAGTAPFYLVFAEDWFADGRRILAVIIW